MKVSELDEEVGHGGLFHDINPNPINLPMTITVAL